MYGGTRAVGALMPLARACHWQIWVGMNQGFCCQGVLVLFCRAATSAVCGCAAAGVGVTVAVGQGQGVGGGY
jgi:hypothetical protein